MNDKIKEIAVGGYYIQFKKPSKIRWQLSIFTLSYKELLGNLYLSEKEFKEMVKFLKNIIKEEKSE